ncbi:hypothetical protein HNR06_001010 [Nocardiopsis arvandica]|uniref:DUF1963 domain-containing protein n=1 Tax=Nocardiopsis sinuspersici TaxID=501010 RepID=A0A7Z0BHV2_9ACTN|nr:hypothetical protein [Nocardiopsis sinuspersici]NYH51421.1 hypothetical protein [Nocardiopsis sinuspersici]
MNHPTPAAKRAQLLAVFPELHDHGKPALLLHPHLGDPGPEDSSVGGPLLWPEDEPWPTCPHGHYVFEAPPEDGDVYYDEPLFLQSVLQLFARDLPTEHTLPGDAELLQVLWCPNDHPTPPDADGHSHTPWLTLRWRLDLTGLAPLPKQPHPHTSVEEYTLPPCTLDIEEITDYPFDALLPEELADRIEEWEDDLPQTGHVIPKPSYSYDLAHRRGMKFGGYQPWGLTDPSPIECECNAPMEHLLQIDSMEPGGLENLIISRGYSLGLHHCPASPDHLHHTVMQ